MLKGLTRTALRRANRFWTTSVAGRTEYRRVWNSVAQSPDDARIAVAGYSNDEEWTRTGELTANDVVTEASVQPIDVVLEIGCGAGRVGAHLAKRCGQWIGSDVSTNMLSHASAALKEFANVSFVPLDGSGLTGVADESIDVVYCTTVFMHLDEWDRFRYVREAWRVLRPGGRLYVDSFSLLSPDGWALFEQQAAVPPNERPPHISKASTPEELTAYVQHAGFTNLRVRQGAMFVTVVALKPAA
jgi:SAM-dependent methyltransferase